MNDLSRLPLQPLLAGPLRALLGIVLATILAPGFLTGCSAVRETFPGHDRDQVWTAMVAAARTPDYDDPDPGYRWTVRENEVVTDEPTSSIEVYRTLDRVRVEPRTKPQRQRQTWRFSIAMEAGYPPRAVFVCRSFTVPERATREGKRYFEDVRTLLAAGAGFLLPPPDDPAATSPPEPTDETPPVIDIDDLEPDDG